MNVKITAVGPGTYAVGLSLLFRNSVAAFLSNDGIGIGNRGLAEVIVPTRAEIPFPPCECSAIPNPDISGKVDIVFSGCIKCLTLGPTALPKPLDCHNSRSRLTQFHPCTSEIFTRSCEDKLTQFNTNKLSYLPA